MSAQPAELNPRDGGPDWAPMTFRASVQGGAVLEVIGMAKRFLAIVCDETIEGAPVTIVHIPTGQELGGVGCKHGPQAYRLADEIIERFPEFGRPFDLERVSARSEELREAFQRHGVIK